MTLNHRQFALPGMEHLVPEEPKTPTLAERWQEGVKPGARPRSEHLLFSLAHHGLVRGTAGEGSKLVGEGSVRGTGYDAHVPPVGMRGSLSERRAIGVAKRHKAASDARWTGMRERGEDHEIGIAEDMDEDDRWDRFGDDEISRHPRTGLPAVGEIREHYDADLDDDQERPQTIGFGFDPGAPHWADFHHSATSAWRKHGTTEWVPTPLLKTPQRTISATRLHAAIENPETTSHPRFAGLGPEGRELPRVFHRGGDDYVIVDGNHRLSADVLQGKLFSEARVVRPYQKNEMDVHNTRMRFMRQNAADNPNAAPEAVQRQRMWDRYYGTGNW